MISIVLVTYNRSKFLELAIQDIMKQTFKNFELIICDDASPDDTENICKKYCKIDDRVIYKAVSKQKNAF